MALLGIDVGTSSSKALVCDDAGSVVGVGSATHPIAMPRPGWTEQHPRDWWRSAVRAARLALEAAESRGVPANDLRAIGLSGQMHGMVLLNADTIARGGRDADALRPAILWNDQRTADQCAQIESVLGGRPATVAQTGNAALAGFTLPKLLWMRAHEPAVLDGAAALLLPKDFVGFCLTGRLATDVGDASGTLLFDVDARAWNPRVIEAFGIDPAILPAAYESCAPVGEVTDHAAAELGVPAGVPVVAGSGDNMAGAIGAGITEPGSVLVTLGTSGVVYAHADAPHRDLPADPARPAGRLHTMCAATGTAHAPGAWCVTGCLLSAAGALEWARTKVWPNSPIDDLMREAADAPLGCEGLKFLPHLTGERCPHPDPGARGGWVGLTARHDRGSMVRAILEGVALNLATILDLHRAAGISVAAVRIGGGGARSELWRQIVADTLAEPIVSLEAEEGPAHGAALLAGVGAGLFASVRAACARAIRTGEVREPIDAHASRYAAIRERYEAIYPALQPIVSPLSDS
ncbi:MAG: xylulokinase [Phycisphaerales bacterium JB037]